MSVRIGLIGDVHAAPGPLAEALSIFRQQGVDHILCVGDTAGYGTELDETVALLVKANCTLILGNHDVWFMDNPSVRHNTRVYQLFSMLSATWEATIEGKLVYAVHASPPHSMTRGITLLDQYENIMVNRKEEWADQIQEYGFDVLIVGHTHQVFAENLGTTLVINPGSTLFNHTCAILSLPEMGVKVFPLPDKTPLKVWNWGMMSKC
jgi:putative phosphoesterase